MLHRIGVVGAGIIGLAVARELLQHQAPDVTVLEKEQELALHQTGHNSGVVHMGVYYPPGSLKARLCRDGAERLADYCAQRSIAFERCGKLIVARGPEELDRLDELERRARANGVPGLRRLAPAQMREIEPHVRGVAALHSPRTAIVDYRAVARAYAEDVAGAGGELRLGARVVAISRQAAEVRVRLAGGETLVFDRLIVCAGLHADRLASLAGAPPAPRIVPFRGEYYRLVSSREHLVRGLIYPVPDPAYPFLGVHFTRRIGGGVDIGPNAILATGREAYRRSDIVARDLIETIRYPGFRALVRRHWRAGAAELWGSRSRRAFVARARTFLPELVAADVEPAPAGVRAQALDPDGALVDDFRITKLDGVVLVRNAPSPAATAALAIAEHIVGELRAA
jgi:L-2-hydroxyglutarate oxidase LhgO